MVLAGCSTGNATPIDPQSDFVCAGVSAAFAGLAVSNNATPLQQRATGSFAEWYWLKNEADLKAGGEDAFMSKLSALGKTLDADPEGAKSAMVACVDRAVADPSFKEFSDEYQARWKPTAS